MADTIKKSGVYKTPDDGTTMSTSSSTTSKQSSGIPKWAWIAALVVLALLLWWAFTPSSTGVVTAPPSGTTAPPSATTTPPDTMITPNTTLPAPAPQPMPTPTPTPTR
jgi:hypothetical protein